MLDGLWRSYKRFCRSLKLNMGSPSMLEFVLIFPIVVRGMAVMALAMVWFYATMFYGILACIILGMNWLWRLIKLLARAARWAIQWIALIAWWLTRWIFKILVFLIECLIAKIKHEPYPPFPESHPIVEKRFTSNGGRQQIARPVSEMTGYQFEVYVANQLRMKGYYNIRLTPATGDYGVDILATRNGIVYAFQCKHYTGSVGVRAVQEVYSGCRKYHAGHAVVITNSTYTPNAKTLARDLGVSLWDLEILNSIYCE